MDLKKGKPDADALMNPTKCLKDEKAGVLNEILKAGHQKEVIDEHLNGDKAKSLLQPSSYTAGRKKKRIEYRERKRTKCSRYVRRRPAQEQVAALMIKNTPPLPFSPEQR